MAHSVYKPHRGTNDYGVVDFVFSFVAKTTTADPDSTLTRGEKVATITCADAGVYVCTLATGFKEVVALQASYAPPSGTPTGDMVVVYPVDEAANPLVFTVKYALKANTALAANPAAATRVYVRAALKTSGVGVP